jgi:hypothetical protein
MKLINKVIIAVAVVVTMGLCSPGDTIGSTAFDIQQFGSFGQRIIVDDYGQAHVVWNDGVPLIGNAYCSWNGRYANGSYFGEITVTENLCSYIQIDLTRDNDPNNQKSVIAYHRGYDGGYRYSFIDIDTGNLSGGLPNDPKIFSMINYVYPHLCVASNNNIILATSDIDADTLHLFITTDEGESWTFIADIDSALPFSLFVRASRNPGSQKVVFVYCQYMDEYFYQQSNNVWYMLSTDNGITWGDPINITNYKHPDDMVNGDSVPWAYCNVNALFDNNDNLHIAWGTHMVYMENNTPHVTFERAKVFHWEEVSDTITQINSPSVYYDEPGGWWIEGSVGETGIWRTAADQPQLVIDPTNNNLFCLWHGNDDTTDVSAGGYFNGEIYGAYSTDNGLTWSNHVNLTNTRSPGATAGDCLDEDFMTANPFIVNDSIYVTYVEDKDAGIYPIEGSWTQNPIYCWVFSKTLIGIEEQKNNRPNFTSMIISPNPSAHASNISYVLPKSGNVSLKLYDATGRLVRNLENGYKDAGNYIHNINTNDLANGTYFVILNAANGKSYKTNLVVLR